MKTNLTKHTTILWADDDPDELAMMREVLDDINSSYHIAEASDGVQVLQYLEAAKAQKLFPCLIVLDLNMPVLNGKETLQRLKQDPTLKAIPTVVFTTSSSSRDQQFCDAYGTEMVTKPITYDALKQIVQKLLHMCAVSVKEQ